MGTVFTWLRQFDEPRKSYEAFKVYRGTFDSADCDSSKIRNGKGLRPSVPTKFEPAEPIRTLQGVSDKIATSYHTVAYWSSKYHWVSRARDYDLYIDRRSFEEMERALRYQAVKWRHRRIDEAERIYNEVRGLRHHLFAMIRDGRTFREADEVIETYPDGRTKTLRRVEPAEWRWRDAALISEKSAELMERAFALILGPDPVKPPGDAEADDDDRIPPEIAARMLEAIGEPLALEDGSARDEQGP